MAPLWDTLDGMLSIASGKVILAKLSEWLQQDYGVSVSAAAVARVLRRDEIAHEVVQVLSAIENGGPSRRNDRIAVRPQGCRLTSESLRCKVFHREPAISFLASPGYLRRRMA
jgi:hypothetical protein